MTTGVNVMNRGPGIISGNLSFIGAFTQYEDAEDFMNEHLKSVDEGDWDVTEASIKTINNRYVVRIMAVKKQLEFEFENTQS